VPSHLTRVGYETRIDIYLDVSGTNPDQTYVEDTRFDFSSSILQPDGSFLRDFVFNGGYYDDTNNDPGSGPRFVFSASTHAGRGAFPKNPGRNPFVISSSGWYTFVHRFYDNGSGVLAVDFSILDASGHVLMTWTLSESTDIISTTAGGNGYGWFALQEFTFLPDDAELVIPGAGFASCARRSDQQYSFAVDAHFRSDCYGHFGIIHFAIGVVRRFSTNDGQPRAGHAGLGNNVAYAAGNGRRIRSHGIRVPAVRFERGGLTHLSSFCGFAESNGAGFGTCKSCRTGGLGGSKK
jgi:hypothetical protein